MEVGLKAGKGDMMCACTGKEQVGVCVCVWAGHGGRRRRTMTSRQSDAIGARSRV